MKILFFGHSLVTRRQWSFVKTLNESTSLDIIYYPPREWGKHKFQGEGNYQVVDVINAENGVFGYYYDPNYILDEIDKHKANLIGGFIEPHAMAGKVIQMCANKAGVKSFFFAYENQSNNFLNYPPAIKENFDVIEKADYILCGNVSSHKIMTTLGAKNPYLVPHTGIETDFFLPYNNKPNYDGVFLGRDVPEKGWKLVNDNLNDLNSITRVYRPIDFIPEMEIPILYNSGKVFVHASLRTSTWIEQLGYVIAEALSCERVVIMSKYGNQVDWFKDAPGVIIYDPLDRESTKSAFEKALTYYPNKAGREWVLKNFSNEAIAKQWKSILT